jgi:hypothetical protein
MARLIIQRNPIWFLVDLNKYIVVTNMRGPVAIKSPVALREINGFLLNRELVRPKIKTSSAHRISFGTFFSLKYAGTWTNAIIVAGNMQASRIATFPIRGGQL